MIKRYLMIGVLTGAIALTGALSGCANDRGPKETIGTLGGAAAGGIIGSNIGRGKGNTAAIIVGTLLGAYAGNEIGKSLDRADRLEIERAESRAHSAPVGQTISWNNPQSGHSGSVTPVRDGTDRTTGAYCREYQSTIVVGGKTEQGYGTACRQPDGSWKVVN
jgi:surface antigen